LVSVISLQIQHLVERMFPWVEPNLNWSFNAAFSFGDPVPEPWFVFFLGTQFYRFFPHSP